MRPLVESLWRLYNEKHSITKAKVESMSTLTPEEKAYILGQEKVEMLKGSLPS